MRDDEYDPVTGDSPEHAGEDVVVMLDDEGQAAILPASLRSLGPQARSLTRSAMQVAETIHRHQAELAELVAELREAGVPWSGIGWLTGMTGEGARQRWGGQS